MASLKFLRVLLIGALEIKCLWEKLKGTKERKYSNLLHYLKGTGEDIIIDANLFEEAHGALERAIRRYNKRYGKNGKPSINGTYFVSHSTFYEGEGFEGRPELFYVIGTFGFTVQGHKDHWKINGEDKYDWHPAKGNHYFSSPLGEGKIATFLCKKGREIWGEEYFPEESWPMKQPNSISNKLWADLASFGAKEFSTKWDFKVPKDSKLNLMLNKQNEVKHQIYLQKFNLPWEIENYIPKEVWKKTCRDTQALRELKKREKEIISLYYKEEDEKAIALINRSFRKKVI